MKISQRGLIVNAKRANRFLMIYVNVFQVVSFHIYEYIQTLVKILRLCRLGKSIGTLY